MLQLTPSRLHEFLSPKTGLVSCSVWSGCHAKPSPGAHSRVGPSWPSIWLPESAKQEQGTEEGTEPELHPVTISSDVTKTAF